MARTHKAEEMTPAEFRAAVETRPVLILTTGILEWHGDHLPLGTDGNRQSMAARFNGHLWTSKGALKLRGRDTARLLWAGHEVHYKFPTGDPPVGTA